jgi:hypothetical protein
MYIYINNIIYNFYYLIIFIYLNRFQLERKHQLINQIQEILRDKQILKILLKLCKYLYFLYIKKLKIILFYYKLCLKCILVLYLIEH